MMVSREQHAVLMVELRHALHYAGDVVEAGCNEGSTSGLLANALACTDRKLHLFDSFEGLPEESGFGGLMTASQSALESSICKATQSDDLPSMVHIHPGWFSKTMPDELPEQIAFAFIDCDVFESVVDSVVPIMDRLTGTIVVHDYTHARWGAGVRRAVDALLPTVSVVRGMAVARREDRC